jgi:serpin B
MLVLLPDEGRFADVETRLNAGLAAETVAALQSMEVNLSLPKFKMEWSSEFSKGLSALGMVDAFDSNLADFSGIDGARDLYIGRIFHKAFVAVDEVGTEAAAATGIVVQATCIGCGSAPEPFRFKADRPFFFIIRDNPTGTILFVGRVINPSI